ncbi:hypothetical protein ACQE3E_20945 [Methylomonas sp. MED-D]|uniref:hypothetical protein n=1 Tax=unclassified Methylomonas TaxID=2608980 RepID=UPI0028A4B6B8|nr:hypothetical protein [Methylomonas sp. MV1]MDT4332084.1 hypothetical protein [Methylomonas sp. MV1]
MRLNGLFVGLLVLSTSTAYASATSEVEDVQRLDLRSSSSRAINLGPSTSLTSVFTRVIFPYQLTKTDLSQAAPVEINPAPAATILTGGSIDLTTVTLTGARSSAGWNISARNDIDLTARLAPSITIFTPIYVPVGGNVNLSPERAIDSIKITQLYPEVRFQITGSPITPTNIPLPASFLLFLSGLTLLRSNSGQPIRGA